MQNEFTNLCISQKYNWPNSSRNRRTYPQEAVRAQKVRMVLWCLLVGTTCAPDAALIFGGVGSCPPASLSFSLFQPFALPVFTLFFNKSCFRQMVFSIPFLVPCGFVSCLERGPSLCLPQSADTIGTIHSVTVHYTQQTSVFYLKHCVHNLPKINSLIRYYSLVTVMYRFLLQKRVREYSVFITNKSVN